MENSKYNSLTDRLIQNGIIQTTNEQDVINKNENFFEKMHSEIITDDITSPPLEETKEENIKKEERLPQRRINEYDLDLIKNLGNATKPNNLKGNINTLKRFLNFKQFSLNKGNSSFFEYILYKFFPKVYKAKLIKKAINKMLELNIDTKTLLDKTIPYGEGESRYEDLIKYLNCANELQTKLKKEF